MEEAKRRGTGEVIMSQEGLSHVERGDLVATPWNSVFGAIAMDGFAYVLCARQPPFPPWVRVDERSLPKGETIDSFVLGVQARVSEGGYRGHKRRMPKESLREKVLRGEHIPGALEVPIGPGPGGMSRGMKRMTLAGVGGLVIGATAGVAAGAAAALGALGVGFSVPYLARRASKRGRRVLVLTPDGCVVGLPGGPRAFTYDELGPFELKRRNPRAMSVAGSKPSLKITMSSGESIGLLDAAWFDAPLALIVAVAEAYRLRHLA